MEIPGEKPILDSCLIPTIVRDKKRPCSWEYLQHAAAQRIADNLICMVHHAHSSPCRHEILHLWRPTTAVTLLVQWVSLAVTPLRLRKARGASAPPKQEFSPGQQTVRCS
ncbi:hypothetical protein Y032_0130g1559 [Ancylostoma ceylanicum]|uniref:Uncharacterized protein n=1 Tax=Ancylostoma ceylanicum TaxID=53326 RepID=A0A016T7A8_9BILA|nr:hypothetical protein Y032_0130g1559 [Ancylostoma ceylanicum]